MLIALAWLSVGLALLPLLLLLRNRRVYRPLWDVAADAVSPTVGNKTAVLIPARNEADNLAHALAALMHDPDPALRVYVLDDASSDTTAAVVQNWAAQDQRLSLLAGQPLPVGWGGKMWACHQLAQQALADDAGTLVFVDADVRLSVGTAAALARLLAQAPAAGLVSGVPRQLTGTGWGHLREAMLVHNILTVLLGYLPMFLLPRSRQASLAGGCGQLLAFSRACYTHTGGHTAVRASVHDGLHLPRLCRRHGYPTRLVDLTAAAVCHMYPDSAAAWRGFRKNAHAGMATPLALPLWIFLLGGGHILPFICLGLAVATPQPYLFLPALLGCGCATAFRVLLVRAFSQPRWLVPLHPLSILLVLALQADSLVRYHILHQRPAWKGRPVV